MDEFGLAVLEWIGRVIAQRLAGSVLDAAWKRISVQIRTLFKKSDESEQAALERDLEADEIAQDTQVSAALLIAANARIKELDAENAALKERLANYESPDNATGNL